MNLLYIKSMNIILNIDNIVSIRHDVRTEGSRVYIAMRDSEYFVVTNSEEVDALFGKFINLSTVRV